MRWYESYHPSEALLTAAVIHSYMQMWNNLYHVAHTIRVKPCQLLLSNTAACRCSWRQTANAAIAAMHMHMNQLLSYFFCTFYNKTWKFAADAVAAAHRCMQMFLEADSPV